MKLISNSISTRRPAFRRRPTSRVAFPQQLEQRQMLAGDICLASDYPAITTVEHFSSVPTAEHHNAIQDPGFFGQPGIQFPQLPSGALVDLPHGIFRSDSLTLHAEDRLIVAQPVWDAALQTDMLSTQVTVFGLGDDGQLTEISSDTVPVAAHRMERVGGSIVLFGETTQLELESGEELEEQDSSAAQSLSRISRSLIMGLSERDLSVQFTRLLSIPFAEVIRTTSDRIYLSAPQFQDHDHSPEAGLQFDVEVLQVSDGQLETIALGVLPAPLGGATFVGDEILLQVQGQTWPSPFPPFMLHASEIDIVGPDGVAPLVRPSHENFVARYSIADGQITEISRLDLPLHYNYQITFSEDGLTATALGTENSWRYLIYPPPAEVRPPVVLMLDLSGDTPNIFETIQLDESPSHSARHVTPDSVVWIDNEGQMTVVNTNQDVDLAAENRITSFSVAPADQSETAWQLIPLGSESQYLVLSQTGIGLNDLRAPIPYDGQSQSQLRLVSTDDQTTSQPVSLNSDYLAFIGDSATQPVLLQLSPIQFYRRPQLATRTISVIQRDEHNELLSSDPVDLGATQFLSASAERLVTRFVDAIEVRTWDALDQPQRIELPSPILPIQAVDDEFEFDGRYERTDNEFLDVLANDQIPRVPLPHGYDWFDSQQVRITELLNAPDGVTIARGNSVVRISAEAFGDNDFVEFDYAIQRNGQRSVASVRVNRIDRSGETDKVMDLRLSAVDASGNPVSTIKVGDEFFLEVTTQDVRRFGSGVFAVGFDLPLRQSRLELTGEVLTQGAFRELWDETQDGAIDEFHALNVVFESPGPAEQEVVRFGVRALESGEFRLQLDAPEERRSENLVHGSDYVVRDSAVNFGSLELTILPGDSVDTDGNGTLSPSDALRVINFLGRHGNMAVDQLASISSTAAGTVAGEDLNRSVTSLRRMDANADGSISIRDALFVINGIARQSSLANSLIQDRGEGEEALVDETIGQLW